MAADGDREYRRTWWSWALYDVANSAFYLVIVAAVFPIFYQELFVQSKGPVDEGTAKILRIQGASRLAFTAMVAMTVVALLGPILGTIADRTAAKKRLLAVFAGLGVVASGLMWFIPPGGVAFASVLYALGTIGVAGSIVFYDALLPGVAREGDLDRISAIGYAAGYLGSVLLMIFDFLMIQNPSWFGLPDKGIAVRLSFVSVAVWWAAFTIPLLRRVPEPPVAASGPGGNILAAAFRRLSRTLREVRRYRQLAIFLAAYWIYSDGIGTVIKMATAFGNSLGIGTADMMLALIITQVVGVPCAMAFGLMARRTGTRAGIFIGLAVYAVTCGLAAFMSKTWHFYAVAVAVGLVQGGTQALSRSLFASMTPRERSAEFFGFFSTVEKFAGILGPLVLGLLWSEGGDPRRGILVIAAFFVLGGIILWKVDPAEGRRAAEESPQPQA
jgi:UMF1 family MFS transporter